MDGVLPIAIGAGILAVVLFGALILITRFYRQVDQGQALIVNTMGSEPVVTFTGAIVFRSSTAPRSWTCR